MCYMMTHVMTDSNKGFPNTQTLLLNFILQHILQAYAKKNKWAELAITGESPMKYSHVDIRRLLHAAGRLCYLAVRERKHVLKIDETLLSKEELLALGLFTEGSDENSVVLPHPLFVEYLAALFLSIDEGARNALLNEIKQKSEQTSPRPRLVDVLRPLGLDNVVRFLVGIMPAAAKQVSSMFVIGQSKVKFSPLAGVHGIKQRKDTTSLGCWQSLLDYELELLEECNDDRMKSVITAALLTAPVVKYTQKRDMVANSGSHHLLSHFTSEQCQLFLNKAYNCKLSVQEGRTTLCPIRNDNYFVNDNYVVGIVYLFSCSIEMEAFIFVHSQLPVHMIAQNMTGVGKLSLLECSLSDEIPEFMLSLKKDGDIPALQQLSVNPSKSALSEMRLIHVRDIHFGTHTLPGIRSLFFWAPCESISMKHLSCAFPKVSEERYSS